MSKEIMLKSLSGKELSEMIENCLVRSKIHQAEKIQGGNIQAGILIAQLRLLQDFLTMGEK